eukprot:scaffold141758_cov16-Prasinocladus_malaysianus.AAC.1
MEAKGESDPIFNEVFRNLSFKPNGRHRGSRRHAELYKAYKNKALEFTMSQAAKHKAKTSAQLGSSSGSTSQR